MEGLTQGQAKSNKMPFKTFTAVVRAPLSGSTLFAYGNMIRYGPRHEKTSLWCFRQRSFIPVLSATQTG